MSAVGGPESSFFQGLFSHVPVTWIYTLHGMIQICPEGNSLLQIARNEKLAGKENVCWWGGERWELKGRGGEAGGGGTGRKGNTKRTEAMTTYMLWWEHKLWGWLQIWIPPWFIWNLLHSLLFLSQNWPGAWFFIICLWLLPRGLLDPEEGGCVSAPRFPEPLPSPWPSKHQALWGPPIT